MISSFDTNRFMDYLILYKSCDKWIVYLHIFLLKHVSIHDLFETHFYPKPTNVSNYIFVQI